MFAREVPPEHEAAKYKEVPIMKTVKKMKPLFDEMYADITTPIEVMRKLKKVSAHCFLLESAEDSKTWGRYTFLGYDPKMEISVLGRVMRVKSAEKDETFETDSPRTVIQEILDAHQSEKVEGLPPFTGGLVGYFAYDYAKYSEPALQCDAPDPENFNDVDLMLFDKVIAFDHLRHKMVLIVNTDDPETGRAELAKMRALVASGAPADIAPPNITSEIKALFDEAAFCAMVERAKQYIVEGDIFQVVLSNRFEADFEGSMFDVYRVLRTVNPSPYMFYFSGSSEIVGASPETLVKLQDGQLSTFPLAGTRKRGETHDEDLALEQELLADEKERAEHNMLVDLGRNDLGKISKLGTVAVEKYLSVHRFSHVMHIGSTVTGEIAPGKTGLDAVDAVLPAGTLSGAPKIRAMQIINELEQNKRGIYGGAIGYLDFTGNADTCIAIRIAYKRGGKVFVRAGAGIVADSDPASEYQECANKAKAVLLALETAKGGIDG